MKASTFKGGIHPEYNKQRSEKEAIRPLLAPSEIVIPLSQHIGAPATAAVNVGDDVLAGQVIGSAGGFVSVPVHSSVSGKVLAIEPRPSATGPSVQSVIIENDGEYKEADFLGLGDDWENTDISLLRDKIKDAGIVGMGGATFPTHVKLSPPKDKPIDTVILNGAECEPYLTADHRVMLERSEDVITGLRIAMKILGAAQGFVGIEVNKQDAIKVMEKAVNGTKIKVVPLQIKYPQGAEKQLIDACIGRQVPSGKLPMDVGAVVQNVGTSAAIADAVLRGRPLIERVVTVTGAAVGKPSNLLAKVGTPVSYAIEACEGDLEKTGKLILGGPMMGFAQHFATPPIIKGTSGILLLTKDEISTQDPYPCIRCGRCLTVCPMHLVPAEIAVYSSKGMLEEVENFDALDCVECGSCAHECPSGIPLVQLIRLGKAAINAAKRREKGGQS